VSVYASAQLLKIETYEHHKNLYPVHIAHYDTENALAGIAEIIDLLNEKDTHKKKMAGPMSPS